MNPLFRYKSRGEDLLFTSQKEPCDGGARCHNGPSYRTPDVGPDRLPPGFALSFFLSELFRLPTLFDCIRTLFRIRVFPTLFLSSCLLFLLAEGGRFSRLNFGCILLFISSLLIRLLLRGHSSSPFLIS